MRKKLRRWRCVGGLILWLAALCLLTAGEPSAAPPPETEPVPQIRTDVPRFRFGAWADMLYLDNDRHRNQIFLKPAHLSLYGKYTWNERLSVFAEVAGSREPNLAGEYETDVELERLYVQYAWRDWAKFRAGKIDNQMGIIKPIHWLITLDTIRRPILEDNSYLPAKSTGLEIYGSTFQGHNEWGYSFTLSHSESEVVDDKPIVRAKSIGLDLSLKHEGRYRLGVASTHYRDPKDKNRQVTGILPYVEWWVLPGKLQSRTEFLYLHRAKGGVDLQAFYSRLKWQIDKRTYLNLRHDQGDDERSAAGEERNAQTLTVGTRLTVNWRVRLEVSTNKVPGELRFTEWGAWIGWIY